MSADTGNTVLYGLAICYTTDEMSLLMMAADRPLRL